MPTNGVPASRMRNRCALDRDIPAARAACATLPLSCSAARKMRWRAGVQRARAGAGGAGVCVIRQGKAQEGVCRTGDGRRGWRLIFTLDKNLSI